MARDFDRQVAEIQIRVAALNKYTALGIPVTEVIGSFRPGQGEVPSRPDLYNKAHQIRQRSGVHRSQGAGLDRRGRSQDCLYRTIRREIDPPDQFLILLILGKTGIVKVSTPGSATNC